MRNSEVIISFDEAIARMAAMPICLRTEAVALARADGRFLAKPVVATRDFPSTFVSAMDGYAVRDADIGPGKASLPIIGKSFAGAGYYGPFPSGTCVRVFTGAPLPEGADRVVIQEEVKAVGHTAQFPAMISGRKHVRPPASDFSAGQTLVAAGSYLNPQRLIAAAAADIAELEVFSKPCLSIICCGDELTEPGLARHDADLIPESISYGVAALARQWGADCIDYARIPDEIAQLQTAAAKACEVADVIVVIGGASVGEKDFSKAMFEPLGMEFVFNKVAIKPGKPIWLGQTGDKVIMGLPGNPTSALVTARLFLAPLLAMLSGGDINAALDWRSLRLITPVDSCNDREAFLKARISHDGVEPLLNQDSAAQRALAESALLIRRPLGAPMAPAGTMVSTLLF